MKNKLLIICGPTATGKTELGIKLAKKFNGEIISADSRQVYQGMDIVTGKDLPASAKLKVQNKKLQLASANYKVGFRLLTNIPAWLIDICRPDQEFSVAYFVKFAKLVVDDLWQRDKLPIVVGGTGFWIKALLEGVETMEVGPDWETRKQLGHLTVRQLRKRLRELALDRLKGMNKSDRHNPRRLIRAIEIGMQAQRLKRRQEGKAQNYNLKLKTHNIFLLGLKTKNLQPLYKRIDGRVETRLRQGAEREVRTLMKKYSWKDSVLGTTIGCKEWKEYFAGRIDLEEVKKRWQFAEHAYARRQMTWFKKQVNIHWVDMSKKDFDKQAMSIVQQWYGKD